MRLRHSALVCAAAAALAIVSIPPALAHPGHGKSEGRPAPTKSGDKSDAPPSSGSQSSFDGRATRAG
jgi:hypothetical protein